jgi:cation diffusion facilitator family transporter
MAAGSGERPITVYGAMAANLVIAVAKFVAAFFTGSSSMLSEGIHSVVDTGNQGLLLLGIKRSKKPPDNRHPFGYGQEIYFWALVVAMLLFSVGGGVSLYEGVVHIRNPEPIREPAWNYAVLGIAFLAEGASWVIAVRHMGKTRRPEEGWFRTFQRSKDPAVFVVVAEDTAAMLGIVVAFLGVWLAVRLDLPWIDGAASIVIGVILVAVAILLVIESRALMLGECADGEIVRSVRAFAAGDPCVEAIPRLLTMQLAPQRVLLNVDIRFRPNMSGSALVEAVDRLEARIREAHPQVGEIFIEIEALRGKDRPWSADAAATNDG